MADAGVLEGWILPGWTESQALLTRTILGIPGRSFLIMFESGRRRSGKEPNQGGSMRTSIRVAIVIAWLAAGSDAMAEYCGELERIHLRSQGDGVSADFSTVDTSTCALGIETTVHVEGTQGTLIVADQICRGEDHETIVTETQTSVVAVVVSVYDWCLGTELRSVIGVGEPDELHVSNNLKTGSLRATIEGLNEFDQTVSIEIDLVWSVVGQRERTIDHENLTHGIIMYVSTSSGTVRGAFAAGSVTVDGTDETPLAATQGTIERDVAHELIVYR